MKLYLHLTPYTKVNSKWIKDLSVGASKAVGLLEENRGEKLYDVEFGSDLLIWHQKAQITKGKISKLDVIKIKNFCGSKDMIKTQPT